jgi:HlyD family secretion protein
MPTPASRPDILTFLVALTAAAPACRQPTPTSGAAPPDEQVPLVEAVPARRGSLPLVHRVSGLVRARSQVEIRPEMSAVLADVLVQSGDSVEKGQPLVRLEPDLHRQALREGQAGVEVALAEAASARARVAELEAAAVRTRKLAEQAIVSALERETLEAQLAAAQASVKQAEARAQEARAALGGRRSTLDKTVVRSPIAGRVGRRQVEVGQLVTPATMLFVVGDLSQVVVDLPVTEKMLAQVRAGQPVEIGGAALGDRKIEARLSRISPFLAAGSFTTTAEVELDNPDGRLLPGMFVTADIAYAHSEQATLVPVSALWEDPRTGLLGVYVADRVGAGRLGLTKPIAGGAEPSEGSAYNRSAKATGETGPHSLKLRPVKILAEGRATAGVEGVSSGEWVVTIGQHLLATADPRAAGPVARVRTALWDRVLELQSRQQEDLLARFLEKQQRLARTIGVELPGTESLLGHHDAAERTRGLTAPPGPAPARRENSPMREDGRPTSVPSPAAP